MNMLYLMSVFYIWMSIKYNDFKVFFKCQFNSIIENASARWKYKTAVKVSVNINRISTELFYMLQPIL